MYVGSVLAVFFLFFSFFVNRDGNGPDSYELIRFLYDSISFECI